MNSNLSEYSRDWHLMIDIETLGKLPGCPVMSIGATFFKPETGAIGDTFYRQIGLASEEANGAKICGDTVLWWMQQSEQARNSLCATGTAVNDALVELNDFCARKCDPDYLQVWANSPSFDLAILANAYARAGLTQFWKFYNERDVRTLVELGRQIDVNPKRDMPFEGEPHYALDDAIHQAKYVSVIWQALLD